MEDSENHKNKILIQLKQAREHQRKRHKAYLTKQHEEEQKKAEELKQAEEEQKRAHEKQEQEKKRLEKENLEKKQEEDRLEQRRLFWNDTYLVKHEVDTILSFISETEQHLAFCINANEAINEVPEPFRVAVRGEDERLYFADLRVIFYQAITFPTQQYMIPHVGIRMSMEEWSRLDHYWRLVNPYWGIQYRSKCYKLTSLELMEHDPPDADVMAHRLMHTPPYLSPTETRFHKDWLHGAHSVALPPHMVQQAMLAGEQVMVEIMNEDMNDVRRVYAYVRNPDQSTRNGSIKMSYDMCRHLNIHYGDKVQVRLISAPKPPPKQQVAIDIEVLVTLDEEVTDQQMQQALQSALECQRILSTGRTIFAYIPDALHIGAIPFHVKQVYGVFQQHRRPSQAIMLTGVSNDVSIRTLIRQPQFDSGVVACFSYWEQLKNDHPVPQFPLSALATL